MVTIQPHFRKVLDRLCQIRAQDPGPFISRFAPSPTGVLHIGHVASAIFVQCITRFLGGRILLRIEDHDKGRCRRPFEQQIINDIDWLGFKYDDGVRDTASPSPYRQSDDETPYLEALERLKCHHHVYRCDCSRKQIADLQQTGPEGEYRYNGRCRDRHLDADQQAGLRIMIGEGIEQFDDLWLGPQQQNPSVQCGDILLRDRSGSFTYQFAVCVDDLRQGVNLVIRGADILPSTGRQILLARLLGRGKPPLFLHHPLINDNNGKKLSKRDGSSGLTPLRQRGITAAEIIGQAAWSTGMISRPTPLTLDELQTMIKSYSLV